MRLVARALLAGGLGFAAALLVAACGGGSGLLSGDQANTLNAQLNQVSSAVGSRNCNAAQNASQSFDSAVASLPPNVNSTVKANLTQGASTISDLAARDCRGSTTPTTPTATTATATTETTSQPTTTTHSTTTTTTSTHPNPPPTTTTHAAPTTPSSGGGGLSGGGGQGGGGSSGGAGGQ